LELHYSVKKINEKEGLSHNLEIFKGIFRKKTILFQIEKCGSLTKFGIFWQIKILIGNPSPKSDKKILVQISVWKTCEARKINKGTIRIKEKARAACSEKEKRKHIKKEIDIIKKSWND
jgi:hypothetical protein